MHLHVQCIQLYACYMRVHLLSKSLSHAFYMDLNLIYLHLHVIFIYSYYL